MKLCNGSFEVPTSAIFFKVLGWFFKNPFLLNCVI